MKNHLSPALLFFLIIVGSACTEDMEAQNQISKFRILGIQAEPPEVEFGATVGLSALFAVPFELLENGSPSDQKKETSVAWFVFNGRFNPSGIDNQLPPLWDISMPAPVDNLGISHFEGILHNAGSGRMTVPEKPETDSDNYSADGIKMTIMNFACAGGTLDPAIFNALGLMLVSGETGSSDASGIEFDMSQIDMESICVGDNPEVQTSIKTFDVTDNQIEPGEVDAPNWNPEIVELQFNEATHPPQTLPTSSGIFECEGNDGCRDAIKIRLRLSTESFQFYRRSTGILTNELDSMYVSWFIDGGEFSADKIRSESSLEADAITTVEKYNDLLASGHHWFNIEWRPPIEGGVYNIWIVAHDLRGGMHWERYQVEAVAHGVK